VLKNLGEVLKAAGSGPEHVLKTTVFLVNLGEHFAPVNAIYEKFFAPHKPARSAVEVGTASTAFSLSLYPFLLLMPWFPTAGEETA
jgi:enamine deaminase RidA (YjgF/YER057c/UK114 family)